MTTSIPSLSSRLQNATYSIFVGSISFATTESELYSFFSNACGNVSTVNIVHDKFTGRSRGFGFVHFNTVTAYENALTLNGTPLAGRKLKISPAQSRTTAFPQITNSTDPIESTGNTLFSSRKTRVVHCKKLNYDVYIGRPSVWGNPFRISRDGEKEERIEQYRIWIMSQPELVARAKKELRGRTIACWCKPEACHGDILAAIADAD